MTEIRVQEVLPTKISVKAYFFNDQKKLVATHDKPAMVNLGKSVYSDLPVITKKNTWYPVFFPINAELEKLKWEWAVIVFIADDRAVAKVFGPGKMSPPNFKFPGKDKIVDDEEAK